MNNSRPLPLKELKLETVIGRTDLCSIGLATETELDVVRGAINKNAAFNLSGLIAGWRIIALRPVGQNPSLHVLGFDRQDFPWMTSPVTVLDERMGYVKTRSGSLYGLMNPRNGEPPLQQVLHVCHVLWRWGNGETLDVPHVSY